MAIKQYQKVLTTEQKLDWIQLIRTPSIGPVTFFELLKRYESAGNALRALPEISRKNYTKTTIYPRYKAEAEWEVHDKMGAKLISFWEDDYPHLLRHVTDAPPLLSAFGRVDLLSKKTFAIVGARNASLNGKKISQTISSKLAEKGWVIASGLARGIDTAAHKGSLATGTIAILAGGLDQIYPAENEDLYYQIKEEGALLAEYPMGTIPQPGLFPRRNRIISGISKGVLVVEAAMKSGSLLTAHYALEQGRDIFAVPGTPLDPRSRGSNQLIKEGAYLVEGVDDIEKELGDKGFSFPLSIVETASQDIKPVDNSSQITELIRENLSFSPITVDELIRECHLSHSEISVALLELEIAGQIIKHPGNMISLRETG